MTGWYAAHGKRVLDIVVSAVGLVVLSPVLVVVAIVVRTSMGRPVLFSQSRAGRAGAPFSIYKFRTMLPELSEDGTALEESARITMTGRLLRSTSLDELPNLVNVLRGDMSLVGPRPLLLDYVARYSPAQARRLLVRPGITGLAQVRGRNASSWEEKFARDVDYVDHISLMMDARILVLTLVQVMRRDGIATEGHATSPHFWGSAASDQSSLGA